MKFLTGFTTKMRIDEVRVDIPLENNELHKKKDKLVTSLEEHNGMIHYYLIIIFYIA